MTHHALTERQPSSWRRRLERWRGSTIEYDLGASAATLAEIGELGEEIATISDAELECRAGALAERARDGEGLDHLLPETFALAREAAWRTVGMRPYDVQVIAGVALHRGRVVEMLTGEGKTLAAVMPVCLAALAGRGAHVLTFNDYLARRDAEWMGPVYRAMGLSVGWVEEGLSAAERRRAYAADVTYVTAKEAGFDHLRDLLAKDPSELVHRPFHFALVDEADSLLIDEARVPLVLAGSAERAESSARELAELVERLEPEVDFATEEYDRNVELTDAGLDRAERELGCGSLLDEENLTLLTELNCALHARALLRRDVDYIVRGGRVELVDEFTGRVAEDRHWPDGLQAALEAKEGLERGADGRILGSITLEHFLGGYPKVCGMTGTAVSAAHELEELYRLGVTVIPTHRPMIREDLPDVVFTHREAKEKAVVEEIRRVHSTGRPVLAGTLTVEESERLAERLEQAGIPCQVLNARNDAEEARIVAGAGALGAVTLSTNMAGRGTDIRLGGEDEAERAEVVAAGGLYVIGTNRHESLRVDLQLRGRAGRQGDPGSTRFFVSLDDDLMVRYRLRDLIPQSLLPEPRDAPLDHPVIRHEIARAQRIIEGQNREIRRSLWRYSTPIEEQRRQLHDERQALLGGGEPGLWRGAGERYDALVAAAGEEAARRAETAVTLHHVDRGWRDHLAFVAGLREGIHLVSLGGVDPLDRFQVETAEAFHAMRDEVDRAVLERLDQIDPRDATTWTRGVETRGPSSTWTYVASDDPFRRQLGRLLTGPGQTTFAIGAAIMAAPFLVLWALVERYFRKR